MTDKENTYKLKDLLEFYSMYNLDFKFYGNNDNGDLELYLKTDTDKISVFKSITKQSKYDYLKLDEISAKNIEFIFDREVDELDLDIVAVVIRTSDINIPCGKYTLKSLDKYVKEQDLEKREKIDNSSDGISYMIVDQNTSCNLYDGVYIFDENNSGFIDDLKIKYENEDDSLLKDNLKIIIDYYDSLTKKSTHVL